MEGSHPIANGREFVDDPAVIGKWKSIGSLAPGEPLSQQTLDPSQNTAFGITKELFFLPEGKPYWIFEGWTKGMVLVHHGGNEPLFGIPLHCTFLGWPKLPAYPQSRRKSSHQRL